MDLVCIEGVTHDYRRHGKSTLFAVLDIATGAVIIECGYRHRLQELLSFLRRIDREVPKELDLQLIAGNFCSHKHAFVKGWLAQRPRFHVQCIPTSAAWLH